MADAKVFCSGARRGRGSGTERFSSPVSRSSVISKARVGAVEDAQLHDADLDLAGGEARVLVAAAADDDAADADDPLAAERLGASCAAFGASPWPFTSDRRRAGDPSRSRRSTKTQPP